MFHPFKGTPALPDRTAAPVSITISTEPLTSGTHDVYFNRGVTGSQAYALKFNNKRPDKQPTAKKRRDAEAWLSRDLDEALISVIESAHQGDSIRGAFYEFRFGKILDAFVAAHKRGVDIKLVIDEKANERTVQPTPVNKLKKPKFIESAPRAANLTAIEAAGLPLSTIIARQARRDDLQHNKFMVVLRGQQHTPVAVWTGSTNLTEGGIYGQANVGHLVRDEQVAARFLAYWNLLAGDPGGPTDAKLHPLNVAFLQAVDALSPAPQNRAAIPVGTTPVFSPRSGLVPLDLYVELLARATSMSCGTFAFGIPLPFRTAISANGSQGPLCFLLLEDPDRPKPTKANPGPVVQLNAKNNTYKASGAELHTDVGRWVAETNNKKIKLNQHVTYVHLKFILSDPLGPDPIVVTGSANFSTASTTENDENMIVIRGDRRVADIYFTEFNRLWGHFYYRSVVEATAARPPRAGTPHNYQDLYEDTEWQKGYEPGDLRSKRVDQFVKMAI